MKGYKVFNSDWTCRNFQYEVDKSYEMEEDIKCCEKGFHFCTELKDCFNYYDFDKNNKVAEIEAYGDISKENYSNDTKCCTNKIKIIREIPWKEVEEMCSDVAFTSKLRDLTKTYLIKKLGVALLGGYWYNGSWAGSFYWNGDSGLGDASRYIGVRLIEDKWYFWNRWDGKGYRNFTIDINGNTEFFENSKFKDFSRDEMYGLMEFIKKNLEE